MSDRLDLTAGDIVMTTTRNHTIDTHTLDADQVDPRPGFYYVSALDGPRSARVRGPFLKHALALAAVETARRELVDLMPAAHFYAFGTCRSEIDLGVGYLDDLEVRERVRDAAWLAGLGPRGL